MADISVPYWNIVDVNMLCEGARLIGFDLDNTLARSKKPMKADMAECFSALTSLIDVAVITGGKYSLLQSQVVDRLSDHADEVETSPHADQREPATTGGTGNGGGKCSPTI